MNVQRRKYDPDFKPNAVRLSEEPGRTSAESGRESRHHRRELSKRSNPEITTFSKPISTTRKQSILRQKEFQQCQVCVLLSRNGQDQMAWLHQFHSAM